ncbi:MAG: hypothetical protein A3F41_01980 [Coxiella sp. RIFCSPHIGHO2_12_FULL_44_14]|nr:MAG: hypothetical protein A3F41_01980 [Coxiella sp. RIFCSPHIGHO2_12_FULL_44_14]
MKKLLISIPDQLAVRVRAAIPARQRSKTITHLIEEEVAKREQHLHDCAAAVEKNKVLHHEMAEWNSTLQDGLNDDDE